MGRGRWELVERVWEGAWGMCCSVGRVWGLAWGMCCSVVFGRGVVVVGCGVCGGVGRWAASWSAMAIARSRSSPRTAAGRLGGVGGGIGVGWLVLGGAAGAGWSSSCSARSMSSIGG